MRKDYITLPLVFISVIVAMIISMRGDENYTCDIDKVIAQQGDTLSGIAHRWCHGNIAKATDDLVARYGQVIYITQEIKLK
jgi:hypothetical protein